ncbi:hypothetical protein B0T22DRAFT_445702 [Podospora appendiculata]|uniref:Uncharacterized protein n=1 Tax=Podospora appendiculata TaxID=314037 RepID=A0AAE0WZ12_9PEZI|nr:hypothetical protein B0T22DRAFT_445702 [Podospora appendiculata]
MATTVLITGADRGIGRVLTKSLLTSPAPTTPSSPPCATHPRPAPSRLLPYPPDPGTSCSSSRSTARPTRTQPKPSRLDHYRRRNRAPRHRDRQRVPESQTTSPKSTYGIDLTEFRALRLRGQHPQVGALKLFKASDVPSAQGDVQRTVRLAPKASLISTWENDMAVPARRVRGRQGGASIASCGGRVRIRRIACWLAAFVIWQPWTDMGNAGAKFFGMEQAVVTVRDMGSVQGILKVIDNGTRESVSGTFLQYDGVLLFENNAVVSEQKGHIK